MLFGRFDVLSFDCYGTLIDWEAGVLAALQPLLTRCDPAIPAAEAMETFIRFEAEQEAAAPSLPYGAVLAETHLRLARAWGLPPDPGASRRFAASLPDWPAFPDTIPALHELGRHARLVILSNVDRANFAATQAALGVDFHAIFTADAIGAYKPDPRSFAFLIDRLARQGIARHRILHVAQSLFHDHAPARQAGLATAWIGRRHLHAEPCEVEPDFYFPDLAALARKAERAASQGASFRPTR